MLAIVYIPDYYYIRIYIIIIQCALRANRVETKGQQTNRFKSNINRYVYTFCAICMQNSRRSFQPLVLKPHRRPHAKGLGARDFSTAVHEHLTDRYRLY